MTHPDGDGGIREVESTWTELGERDPMWAVLTDRGKDDRRWDTAEFLATGVDEIAAVLARLDALGATPGRERAVDFGCGAGRLSHGLATAGFAEVVGLDISATMLDAARSKVACPPCDFRLARTPELDVVPDDAADLVYTCRVLQHMPSPLAQRYVRSFFRIARPGALVVFQMPTTPANTPAGLALRALPAPLARRLRRGMEMHGTAEARVRALVAECGGEVLAVDPDTSAGPRWQSRLYLTRAGG